MKLCQDLLYFLIVIIFAIFYYINYTLKAHGETFDINYYYNIFQFREKRITLRIFVGKNTKLYNNDMKLQYKL